MTEQISIVIPVYNSENSLSELTERIIQVMEHNNYIYEIIFVNDASTDNSYNALQNLFEKYTNITIIHLDKNAGQHAATFCGLVNSNYDIVIVICDDLQHAPEDIPLFIAKINMGYDVVYAKLVDKKTKLLIGSWIMQKLLHIVLHVPKNITLSDYFAIRKKIIKRISSQNPSRIQYNALILYATNPNKIVNVDVVHYNRKYGTTNYSMIKYLRIFLDLTINHSSIPLQFIGIIGIFVSIISFIFASYLVIQKMLYPQIGLEGWTSLMVAMSLLSGILLFSFGILGEYLQRLFYEVNNRPPFYIDTILSEQNQKRQNSQECIKDD
ncbi:MAG: glycosyltransferase family 2 protein [Methanospirillaceae archaeon]|nr:glycosyltransferase family 2 protein [Methanospirillaceae archaeon]